MNKKGTTAYERIKERARKWYAENKERAKEKARKWALANPDKVREKTKRWNDKHRDKVQEKSKKFKAENPDKVREYVRKWHTENPEKVRANNQARRARKKGNGGKVSAEEWQWLKEFYDYSCLRCGRREPEITLTLDHVLPLALGGKNIIGNAQPLCGSCNSSKKDKYVDYRKTERLI